MSQEIPRLSFKITDSEEAKAPPPKAPVSCVPFARLPLNTSSAQFWNKMLEEAYFLSSEKITLSFRNSLARFSAWNIPNTKTLFISTSGHFASLRLKSNLPAAIVNLAQSISCSKGTGGGGTNYLLSSVLTDSCWEESKPRSGLLAPGECSSAQWEDRDSFVPTWDPETKTYNKPTRFIQV